MRVKKQGMPRSEEAEFIKAVREDSLKSNQLYGVAPKPPEELNEFEAAFKADMRRAADKTIRIRRAWAVKLELEKNKRIDENADAKEIFYAYHILPSDSQIEKIDVVELETLVISHFKMLSSDRIEQLSLEAQIWWRDYLTVKAMRSKEQRSESERIRLREAALDKLSPEERSLLGIAENFI